MAFMMAIFWFIVAAIWAAWEQHKKNDKLRRMGLAYCYPWNKGYSEAVDYEPNSKAEYVIACMEYRKANDLFRAQIEKLVIEQEGIFDDELVRKINRLYNEKRWRDEDRAKKRDDVTDFSQEGKAVISGRIKCRQYGILPGCFASAIDMNCNKGKTYGDMSVRGKFYDIPTREPWANNPDVTQEEKNSYEKYGYEPDSMPEEKWRERLTQLNNERKERNKRPAGELAELLTTRTDDMFRFITGKASSIEIKDEGTGEIKVFQIKYYYNRLDMFKLVVSMYDMERYHDALSPYFQRYFAKNIEGTRDFAVNSDIEYSERKKWCKKRDEDLAERIIAINPGVINRPVCDGHKDETQKYYTYEDADTGEIIIINVGGIRYAISAVLRRKEKESQTVNLELTYEQIANVNIFKIQEG